jgi:signal transduction histidine kinase
MFNSVKFTEKGSVKLEVKRHNNNSIIFKVMDTGIGIKKEDKSKIFTEFGKTGYLKKSEGPGLGLALAKRFINMQSGKIGFESEYNKGSEFWLSLPVS